MITHTISVTELIWTLFCTVGLFYNLRIFVRAVHDLSFVRSRKINSIREYSARLTVIAYLTWVTVQGGFVFVGLSAMTIPPPPHTSATSPLQILITGVFLLLSFILALGSYFNETGRQKLVNMLRELET